MPRIGLQNIRDFVRYRALRLRMAYYRCVEDSYAAAWERLMAYRVQHHGADPATGVVPDGAGRQQLEFLQSVGVQPTDRVLDFGCGSLRLGQHLIGYLDPGNYVGADISPDVLEAAEARLPDGLLERRQPRLVCNDGCSLGFVNAPVDLIWAHSVVTHLPESQLRELLESFRGALAPGGCLLASYFPDPRPNTPKDFGYPDDDLERLAAATGVEIRTVGPDVYPNPHDQSLMCVTPAGVETRFWPPEADHEIPSRVRVLSP